MKEYPKVSILIPTFNQSRYIAQAVESALAQNYPHLEVIVSDDASGDGTRQVLQRFTSDPRFQYKQNLKRRGRVGNYRLALYEYARGDYVLNLDGDDYLIDESYISRATELIQKHELIMVFAKQQVLIEKSGAIIEDTINSDLPKIIHGNWLFINYYRGYSIPHLSTLYHRETAMQIGYYTEDILSSDWESVLRLLVNHDVGFINAFVGVWRKYERNVSKSLDIPQTIANTAYIEKPYACVAGQDIFETPALDKWRQEMLKRYFIKMLAKTLLSKDNETHQELLRTIQEYDREIYAEVQRDIGFTIIKIVSPHPRLRRLVFKHILKMESFLADLE